MENSSTSNDPDNKSVIFTLIAPAPLVPDIHILQDISYPARRLMKPRILASVIDSTALVGFSVVPVEAIIVKTRGQLVYPAIGALPLVFLGLGRIVLRRAKGALALPM